MLGVVGKIHIQYNINDNSFEETMDVNEEAVYALEGCPECIMVIEEAYYVIDTVYGVTVYFNENEENCFLVSGNEVVDFEVEEYGITGKMKIVMF